MLVLYIKLTPHHRRSNDHTPNPQLQQALALQRLEYFMADPAPTSMSDNTCGHTTMEAPRSRMAGKLAEFDERFNNTGENNINKG
jgi:hypothetical protein